MAPCVTLPVCPPILPSHSAHILSPTPWVPPPPPFLQGTLKSQLGEATVLTIAHRLHTIMYYDRVVVLDAGHVVESGEPMALKDAGGRFSQMWAATGDDNSLHGGSRLARAASQVDAAAAS